MTATPQRLPDWKTVILAAVCSALISCGVTSPHEVGMLEHTGDGIIVIFKPETTWKHATIVHQNDYGYVKKLEPVCDGLPFPVWTGERVDVQFRWDGWGGGSDYFTCYEILNVIGKQKP